jgi:hypothetical protein
VVEFVLRDINIGNILLPAIEKVRKDHPIHGPVSDYHDVL